MNEIVAEPMPPADKLQALSKIIEQAAEGVVIIGPDRIVWLVNTAWGQMHGYGNTADLLGEHIKIFHTKEQMKTELAPLLEETKRRGRIAGPIDHMKRDGTTFPTQTKILLLKSPSNKPSSFIILTADRTDSRKSKARLEQQSAELDQLRGTNEQLDEQVAQLKAANEQLRDQTVEQEGLTGRLNDLQEYANELEQRNRELEQQTTAGAPEQQPQQPVQAQKRFAHQMRAPGESEDGFEQHVGELVDAKTIASEILGISRMSFWLLRVRGRVGPKPIRIDGTLRWELSSILRWIEWNCCDMAEFQAREKKELGQS